MMIWNYRNNPDRIRTLAEKYFLTKDPEDAIDLAEEYLRNIELSEDSEINDMEVANYHMESGFDDDQESAIFDWMTDTASFIHTDHTTGEWIFYIKETYPELGPGAISDDYAEPIRSIFREARNQGYAYLCIYTG